MAIIGNLLKRGIKLRESLDQEYSSPYDLQKHELKHLLMQAVGTEFGKAYNFKEILGTYRSRDSHAFFDSFRSEVPIHDYNRMYNDWWHLTLKGKKDVTWPGRVRYFALSSGTSEASTKHIPITKDMVKAIRKTSLRQILTLGKYDLPPQLFQKGIMMLGGSTDLNNKGTYYEGDLSGITASKIPFWFQVFYKPGKKIAKTRDWAEKLDEITLKAKDWDIGIIVGVPAWIQLLIEKIIAHYGVSNIHEIWPNLSIFVHGGVSFTPYKKGFEQLLGKPIQYIETYLASEGFLAFQAKPGHTSMRLVLNNSIFYEFVPFVEQNLDENGNIRSDAPTLMIDQVEEGKDYAILLTTTAGAWRYVIGDVVRFTDKDQAEIIITGRTKHFLSLCGEHLSVDNMNRAVALVSDELNINIKEFTVIGKPDGTLFGHHWYIGTDDKVDAAVLRDRIDHHLRALNDDYHTEREHALKGFYLTALPTEAFYQWMREQGKEGGQNKFPRVINKPAQLESWEEVASRYADKIS